MHQRNWQQWKGFDSDERRGDELFANGPDNEGIERSPSFDRATQVALDSPSRSAFEKHPGHKGSRDAATEKITGGPRFSTIEITAATIVALVLTWWGVSAIINDMNILPTPEAVGRQAITLATTTGQYNLWLQIEASTVRVVVGWGIGAAIGIALGSIMASSRYARNAIDPILEAGRAIPPLAFAPLMVVWLGIGEVSKVALLVTACAPVMAISTVAGIIGVDECFIRTAQTLGASRTYLLKHVVIPGALPEIVTGLRLTSGITWATLVAAEYVASTKGLGWMILQASRYLDTATIFVGIAAIGLFAFLMDRVIRLFERRLLGWRGKA